MGNSDPLAGISVGDNPMKLSSAPPFSRATNKPKLSDLPGLFEAELKESGVKYEIRSAGSNTSPAHLTPFLYAPGEGKPTYLNTMYVDEGRAPALIKISKRHEGAHAILWSCSAAAHASPYNMASPIVLCPRDWGRFMRNSERAAMAYNAAAGFVEKDPDFREALAKEPGTAEDFAAAMLASGGNIEAALNRVARECLEKNSNYYMLPTGKRKEKEYLTLRNYYTWYSLRRFEDSNTFTWDYELADMPAPIFVRLDDEDILQIGQLLGFSAFGRQRPDSFFTEQDPLMWKHQRWQESLNYKMGILNSDQLPTVRQALRRYFGKTPDEFLEFSKNYKQGDPPLPQINPVEPTIIPFPTYR
jgi:hypothetical protein